MTARRLRIGLSVSLPLAILGSCGNAKDSWNGLIVSADNGKSLVTGPYATAEECRVATLNLVKPGLGQQASCSQNCVVRGDLISDCKSTVHIN